MFCTQCGAKIEKAESVFCPQCGSRLKREEAAKPAGVRPEFDSKVGQTAGAAGQIAGHPSIHTDQADPDIGRTTVLTSNAGGYSTDNEINHDTEILNSPYVVNPGTIPSSSYESGNQGNKKSSGALKWILIGAGALLLILIILLILVFTVILPRVWKKSDEGTKDLYGVTTETRMDDTDTWAVTTTEKMTEATTEAPAVLVESIQLDSQGEYIMVGSSVSPVVTVGPADATDQSLLWSSDHPEIATVDASGVVTGIATGYTVIRCTSADGSGAAAQYEIMVVATPSEAFAAHLYASCLGRSGTTEELKSWASRLDSGEITPGQAAMSFCKSVEFNQTEHSDEEYIMVLYRTFFNREYDQAGMEHWLELLQQGLTREEILERFTGSDEFTLYLQSLGVSPVSEE